MKAEASIDARRMREALLAQTAWGHGAIELAIGDRLARLARADRFVDLGYVSLGDYVREELDLGASRGYELAALAAGLWQEPELRAAVHAGTVTPAEARRRIAAGRATAAEAVGAEERWQRLVVTLTPDQVHVLETTLEVAGLVSSRGLASSRWQRLEHVFQEFIGEHGAPEVAQREHLEPELAVAGAARDGTERAGPDPPHGPDEAIDLAHLTSAGGADGALLAELAAELKHREDLTRLMPPPGRHAGSARLQPAVLDRELRELARLRTGWDELFGRLAAQVRESGAWRVTGIVRWEDYCAIRLGCHERTVRRRVHLERRLRVLPELREALRSGRIGVEKALEIGSAATVENLGRWLEEGASCTVIDLRRHLEREADRKMSGTGVLQVPLPERVDELRGAAFAAARERAGRPCSSGECLLAICLHFLGTWGDHAVIKLARMHPVRLRDGSLCQAPGCSRPGEHVHHMWLSSLGGSDHPDNLLTLCPPHHLQVVHRGFLIVEGTAPHAVVWRVGPELVRLREEAARTRAA
jgi:hypothetical protein